MSTPDEARLNTPDAVRFEVLEAFRAPPFLAEAFFRALAVLAAVFPLLRIFLIVTNLNLIH